MLALTDSNLALVSSITSSKCWLSNIHISRDSSWFFAEIFKSTGSTACILNITSNGVNFYDSSYEVL